jgi:cobalt transporter subunit CbtB
MQNAVRVDRVPLLFVWIAVLLTLTLMITGYGLDTLVPMVHDSFHDARHAAGFACH